MNLNNAAFYKAYGTFEQLENSNLPEFCFSGRSNVGKSSLINKLCNRKSLARVSTKPGKTVTINFYTVDKVYFVDLPGYGYAKVPFAEKDRWSDLMEGYFNSDRNIKLVFQLIDMRHPPTDFDISMLDFMYQLGIPYAIILTKSDKLNKSEYAKQLALITEELGELGEGRQIIPFSALKGDGKDEILSVIESIITGQ